jgi:hypothetical protein
MLCSFLAAAVPWMPCTLNQMNEMGPAKLATSIEGISTHAIGARPLFGLIVELAEHERRRHEDGLKRD